MDFNGKKVSVVGLARSGYNTAALLLKLGAFVFVSDGKSKEEAECLLNGLDSERLTFEFGANTSKVYEGRDLVILSPGVSINHPVIAEAIKQGVPVIGEMEFAYHFAKAPIIAVTGTNGKSTTVSLIHNMFDYCNIPSILAGNIGTPLTKDVMTDSPVDWIVAEVSSFQLETISAFRPKIGVITNITVDHTDRHNTMENYAAVKARIFENQTSQDYAVMNFDDQSCRAIAGYPLKSKVLWFSVQGPVPEGWFLLDDYLCRNKGYETKKIINVKNIPLKGTHNILNVLALMCIADIVGIDYVKAAESLFTFQPLHHRLQLCGNINGISFYDDSKGSNPGAVIAALEASPVPISLIAGGKDKSMDFTEMCERIAEKVHALIVIGETGPVIAQKTRAFGFDNIIDCGRDFELAVRTAYKTCSAGGSVLLSPACASFDMFRHAEHRGDEFKRIVAEMEKEAE